MYISPKTVLADFLRHRLTDPRARAEDIKTETFNGGSTEYSLNPDSGKKHYSVTDVSVEGSSKSKWKDYYIDQQNSKIIFFSATSSGTDNVSISYKQGATNWIYEDKSRTDLNPKSFPRVNILIIGGSGNRLGTYKSNMEVSFQFQIDIWTKEKQAFTIDNHSYEGDKLSEYLANQVTKAFEDYVDELHPQLYSYFLTNYPRDLGFNRDMECFHHIVEVELKGVDPGEE